MRLIVLLIAAISLQGCAVGLLANALGAKPGNVPAMHPEQQVSTK